jgi:hypothetical protein
MSPGDGGNSNHFLLDFGSGFAGGGRLNIDSGAAIGFLEALGFLGSRPLRFWPLAISLPRYVADIVRPDVEQTGYSCGPRPQLGEGDRLDATPSRSEAAEQLRGLEVPLTRELLERPLVDRARHASAAIFDLEHDPIAVQSRLRHGRALC